MAETEEKMINLYKNTIIICGFLAGMLYGLSLVLYNYKDTILVNYMIGIGSSLIVVIITTYIQYRREKERRISKIEDAIRDILFKMELIFVKGYCDDYENDYSEIAKKLSIIEKLSTDDLYLFPRRNKSPYEELAKLTKRILLVSSASDNVEKRIVRIVSKKYYIGLARKAMKISKYRFEKDMYLSSIERLKTIEKTRGSLTIYESQEDRFKEYLRSNYHDQL